jgi:hypothetical protein
MKKLKISLWVLGGIILVTAYLSIQYIPLLWIVCGIALVAFLMIFKKVNNNGGGQPVTNGSGVTGNTGNGNQGGNNNGGTKKKKFRQLIVILSVAACIVLAYYGTKDRFSISDPSRDTKDSVQQKTVSEKKNSTISLEDSVRRMQDSALVRKESKATDPTQKKEVLKDAIAWVKEIPFGKNWRIPLIATGILLIGWMFLSRTQKKEKSVSRSFVNISKLDIVKFLLVVSIVWLGASYYYSHEGKVKYVKVYEGPAQLKRIADSMNQIHERAVDSINKGIREEIEIPERLVPDTAALIPLQQKIAQLEEQSKIEKRISDSLLKVEGAKFADQQKVIDSLKNIPAVPAAGTSSSTTSATSSSSSPNSGRQTSGRPSKKNDVTRKNKKRIYQ